jgi:glycosyltransferase involved in cell wall biosynthesis
MPDISVVIPTFRRPRELSEALGSVLAQDVSLDVTVVDDSPEQSARPVVEQLDDDRVRYRAMPTPTGGWPSRVRNEGWPSTHGRFLHFLDDDDLVPRGHYAQAVADFEAHPDAGVLFGRVQPFGDDERQTDAEAAYFQAAARRARICQRLGRWAFASRQYFERTMLVCSAGLIRRECVEAMQGFDADCRLVEDAVFFARAFREHGAHFVDRVVLHYRIAPSLMRSSPDPAEFLHSYRRAHESYRSRHGRLEFLALKAVNRAGLRYL